MRRNYIAQDLRTDKYRLRVIPDKRDKYRARWSVNEDQEYDGREMSY